MNKLFVTSFLLGVILLFAGNASALAINETDTVKMTVVDGQYTMTNMAVSGTWSVYKSFCVERTEYFNPGGVYDVDSVENYANAGGGSAAKGAELVSGVWQDPISNESVWLYASYLNGLFGTLSSALALKVQNAIWYWEDEFSANETGLKNTAQSYWNQLSAGRSDFTITGWDVKVVNLSQNHLLKQSQLVGAPVPNPEPATMVLLGIGLLGLAGVSRRIK